MNKIGKIAHNISVRNTSQNDFIKIEITPSVFNIFARTFWNRLLPKLFWAAIFDVGLQGDRDILKYIVGILLGGPKVSLHTLDLIAQSLSAQSK